MTDTQLSVFGSTLIFPVLILSILSAIHGEWIIEHNWWICFFFPACFGVYYIFSKISKEKMRSKEILEEVEKYDSIDERNTHCYFCDKKLNKENHYILRSESIKNSYRKLYEVCRSCHHIRTTSIT